jgi:hypothetical protein
MAGRGFSVAGLSLELPPLPHPVNITENKTANNAIKMNFVFFMTLLHFNEGILSMMF